MTRRCQNAVLVLGLGGGLQEEDGHSHRHPALLGPREPQVCGPAAQAPMGEHLLMVCLTGSSSGAGRGWTDNAVWPAWGQSADTSAHRPVSEFMLTAGTEALPFHRDLRLKSRFLSSVTSPVLVISPVPGRPCSLTFCLLEALLLRKLNCANSLPSLGR